MIDTADDIIDAVKTSSSKDVYELVLQRIKLRAKRRIAWLRKLWSENNEKASGSNTFNYHMEVDGCLDITDSIADENNWYENNNGLYELNKTIEAVETKLKADHTSRLAKLAKFFKLNAAEKDILHAFLALYLDPNLARVYAYIQDHTSRTFVTGQLVARLFGHGSFLTINSSSPLFTWGLINEIETGKGEPARFEPDPFIRNWILGANGIDSNLSGIAAVQPVHSPLNNWPVTEKAALLKNMLKDGRIIRLFITGSAGAGKKSFAAAVCKKLNKQLLCVKSDRITAAQWPALFIQLQRQAWLGNYALLWEGTTALENHWPVHIPLYPLQFVVNDNNSSTLPNEAVTDIQFAMPALSAEETFSLWQKFIPASSAWKESDLINMIKRQQPVIAAIVNASKTELNTVAEASELLRSYYRRYLGNLAQLINSSFTWNDLVVTDSLRNGLDDLYYEATERATVWENDAVKKHFPQGRGLIALFTGSPGTGKTMAAQVIANSLQLDLFRIDLSSVVSKYVGETSKNIERILSRAAGMNAVLLFDEADALFGKRTDVKDAHDRFANTDTNYLLQAIEDYPGIAILASNKKSGIDNAFYRRLRYVLDFAKPGVQQRLLLWQKLLAELTGEKTVAALKEDIKLLAELVEVTGAQIKQAVLSAIFISKREKKNISIAHILKGMERELVKEGRGVGKQAMEIMLQNKVMA